MQMSVSCLTQGPRTGQELRHYNSLRDAAARQLETSSPLYSGGSVPRPCLSAASAPTCPSTPLPLRLRPSRLPQVRKALDLQFRAGPSNSSSQCTYTFVPGICCIPMLSSKSRCAQDANWSQLLILSSQPLRPVQALNCGLRLRFLCQPHPKCPARLARGHSSPACAATKGGKTGLQWPRPLLSLPSQVCFACPEAA